MTTRSGGTVIGHGASSMGAGEYVRVEFTDPPETKVITKGDVDETQWAILMDEWEDAKPQPSTVTVEWDQGGAVVGVERVRS